MITYTLGDWKYNPKFGSVNAFKNTDDKYGTSIAHIFWYDAPFAAEFMESIVNGRLISLAPRMCKLMEDIVESGLTMDNCIEIKKMLNYIYCEDLPHDKDGNIDWDKYPEDLLPDTRD